MPLRRRLFTLLLPLLLSGCSALIPGMHPSVHGGPEKLETEVSAVTEGGDVELRMLEDAQAVPTALRGLRVVTLTPQMVASVAREQRDTFIPQPLAVLEPGGAPDEYVLGAGDIISVTVWDHPELTNPAGDFRDAVSSGRLVGADGSMFYPYVGMIRVQGLTVAQLRQNLAEQLARVIQSPQVDVRVAAYRSQRVQVSGEVAQPGLVSLDDTPRGIIEALSERGGLTEFASRRRVILTRGGRRYEIDLSSLLSGERIAGNPMLAPGDLIHVPDRSEDQVFVMGEVKTVGPVYMNQRRLTLTEALATSGGLDKLSGDDRGVLIFRRPSGDEGIATVFRADLSSAVGVLLAGEMDLQPRDVVYVSSTAFAKYNSVINQMLPTISAIFQIDRLTAAN